VDQTYVAKKKIESKPECGRTVGRPRMSWIEDGENDLCELKVKR
jgi:hypothetical protein